MDLKLIALTILTYPYSSILVSTVANPALVLSSAGDNTNAWELPSRHITSGGPANCVVIHHLSDPTTSCSSPNSCRALVRSLLSGHVSNVRRSDHINFLIGGDGNVYEGHGFDNSGTQGPHYNSQRVVICMIGNWSDIHSARLMRRAFNRIIAYGITNGYITRNYKLERRPIFTNEILTVIVSIRQRLFSATEHSNVSNSLMAQAGPRPSGTSSPAGLFYTSVTQATSLEKNENSLEPFF